MTYVFRIGDAPDAGPLGGKAGTLARLHGQGFPIPEWFAVRPQAFAASLPPASRKALAQLGRAEDEQERAAILQGIVPARDVVEEVEAALAALCPSGELVAVRSSALAEDGTEFSYAGQLQSFLSVPHPSVLEAMVAVWRSAFSRRVLAYRAQHQIGGMPTAPAVIIQRMVHAEAAGVAFGADPITGLRDQVVVAAVRGLGDSLVSGDANADEWQVDLSGGIVHRRSATSTAPPDPPLRRSPRPRLRGRGWPRAAGSGEGEPSSVQGPVGTSAELVKAPHELEPALLERGDPSPPSFRRLVAVRTGQQSEAAARRSASTAAEGQSPPAQSGESSPHSKALDEVQVRMAAALVRRAGEVLGHPQDVEWALEKGALYLLQSRPITGITAPGTLNIWDNSNIVESYSGVTSPLTFSFARRAYAGVYREFCRVLAVPKRKIAAHQDTFPNLLGLIRGRIYYNLLNWYRILALLPGFTLNRRFMEQMMGVKEELPAEILATLENASVGARLRDGLDVGVSLGALVANHFLLPRKIRTFDRRLHEALAPPPLPLEAMSAPQLASYFLELQRKLLTRWDAPLLNDFFAMIFFGVLRRLSAQWLAESKDTLPNDLLCGGGGMISAEPAERIRELARLACSDATLLRQLEELGRGSASDLRAAINGAPEFKAAYEAYLAKFGDRCLSELKLESLTLHDDPTPLLRTVGELARRLNKTADLHAPAVDLDVRDAAEAEARRVLAGQTVRRLVFNWVLRHARARVRDRENLRFERTRLFARVRRVFVELGRRLHEAGRLQQPRDVFWLEIDEALGSAEGHFQDDLKAIAARRQAVFSEYHTAPAPPNRFSTRGNTEQISGPATLPALPKDDAVERLGTGCCPGVVQGRIRRITDPHDAVIQQGEILVAERTDPGWIVLFASAAGLLVERGSLLSHSAIVARELRIPAIVSIDGLMGWLQDGDLVQFDGSTGRIRRLAGPNADGPSQRDEAGATAAPGRDRREPSFVAL